MPKYNPPLGRIRLRIIQNPFKKAVLYLIISIFLLTTPIYTYSEKADIRTGIVTAISRKAYKDDHVKVIIYTSEQPDIRYNKLKNPDRLYVDILHSRLGKALLRGKKKILIKSHAISIIRYAQNSRDRVRIVFNIGKSVKYSIKKKDNSVVVDAYIRKRSKGNKAYAGSAVAAQRAKKKRDKISSFTRDKIIVIDPGHGGKDPGAIGPGGLLEKDVVLDISLMLSKLLSSKLGLKVILTRKEDIFIPIRERTKIANRKEADLFISIHANADNDPRSRGVETYYLSRTTSQKALETAARENRTSLKDMEKTDLEFILADLKSTYKINESIVLSNHVQKQIVKMVKNGYPQLRDLGVRKGPFYVLLNANMPSILIESFFITNRGEEKRLRDKMFREAVAKSIFKGIKIYLKETYIAFKSQSANK